MTFFDRNHLCSFLFFLLASCGGSNNSTSQGNPDKPLQPTESPLPNRISCDHSATNYQLILILKDDKLPDGVTAIGLKYNSEVIFKVATNAYTDRSESNTLSFVEIPSTPTSREVKLDLVKKSATLLRSQIQELDTDPVFDCTY